MYREWRPRPRLTPIIDCFWLHIATEPTRILPDARTDLIFDGEQLTLAGPDTGAWLTSATPGTRFLGVRFQPGIGPTLLGIPGHQLRNERPAATELWTPAKYLTDELAEARSLAQGCQLLESAVLRLLAEAPEVDPGIALIARTAAPVSTMADRLGITERTLHRRCTQAFGYGYRTLHRILRFRRALQLAESGRPLAEVAAGTGYADQAHFSRDTRTFSGLSTQALIHSRTPANPQS
ncbi:AraC family transcriptional regulator [Pseudonocardiaceae bacterium YIM PH 21723]|nr:AraC family transcriptional regulator [Pseudonocardiaceae bacterium YIM PH 21723]